MSVPNETWSERFEREVEACLALLRRRPLLAIIFAAAMTFFAWNQFFKNLKPAPDTPPQPVLSPQLPISPDTGKTIEAANSVVKPEESATESQRQASRPGNAAAAAPQPPTPAIDVASPVQPDTMAMSPKPSARHTVSLSAYFDQPIAIGDSRDEVAKKISSATWGQNAQGIFASISTRFLGEFPGSAILFFSNDVVKKVNFIQQISGSTMIRYRLHGTEDEWDEKKTTNGEDMNYAEAAAKCGSFSKLRPELIQKFGAAITMKNSTLLSVDSDPRTTRYSKPADEEFDATYATPEMKLHVRAYEAAFIRDRTNTIMAREKLSNHSCSIRAEFIENEGS